MTCSASSESQVCESLIASIPPSRLSVGAFIVIHWFLSGDCGVTVGFSETAMSYSGFRCKKCDLIVQHRRLCLSVTHILATYSKLLHNHKSRLKSFVWHSERFWSTESRFIRSLSFLPDEWSNIPTHLVHDGSDSGRGAEAVFKAEAYCFSGRLTWYSCTVFVLSLCFYSSRPSLEKVLMSN